MANHSKFIKLLLSFVIAFSPILLINNANAAIGGWTLSNPIAQGASTLYQGAKNVMINGKNVAKTSTALITPTATGVAKVLAKGVAGVALSVAVEQLLGAVDWVLDPANNQIKYKPDVANDPDAKRIWWGDHDQVRTTYYKAATRECANHGQVFKGEHRNFSGSTLANSGWVVIYCVRTSDGYRDTWSVSSEIKTDQVEEEEKTLPLDVVAAQVISNAESGDTDAQVATTAAAADIVAEAEKDSTKARPIVNQLESSAETATDETATGEATKSNTADPTAPPDVTNISLKFPVFCGWAPTVCQAASVVISFPTLVTEWWETANTKADGWATSISESWAAAKEWATSEPSQDNTQVDVENNNTQEIDTQVSFSSQCPANIKLADFSYHGISQSWDVDFSKFCDVFATYLRPVVISIGAFSAVLIVSGVGVRENG